MSTRELMNWLARYWMLIAFLGGVVVSVTTAQAQIGDQGSAIHALQQKDVDYDRLVVDRTDRLGRIETHLGDTDRRLERMDNKLDTLLERTK